jgi:hypothetical protein
MIQENANPLSILKIEAKIFKIEIGFNLLECIFFAWLLFWVGRVRLVAELFSKIFGELFLKKLYCFTPKTTQWVLFEFVCKNSLGAWYLGHFILKISQLKRPPRPSNRNNLSNSKNLLKTNFHNQNKKWGKLNSTLSCSIIHRAIKSAKKSKVKRNQIK